MKSVRCVRAMSRGIGQWTDDLHLLDDRTGPSVGDDEWQRILMFRANVDEMDIQPVNLGDELRQGIQFRFDLAPIVVVRPIVREFLHRTELHALKCVADEFPLRPLCRLYACAQFVKFSIRNFI